MNFLKTKITGVYLKNGKICMDLFQTACVEGEVEVRDVVSAVELPFNTAFDKRTDKEVKVIVLSEESLEELVDLLNNSVQNNTVYFTLKQKD